MFPEAALVTVLCGLPPVGQLPDLGPPLPHVASFTGAPQSHDAFGTFENTAQSEHFELKWGPNESFSEQEQADILEIFETSWDHLVDQFGLARPAGTDTHFFNVYIGDTGSPAPSAFGNGGYYTVDRQGQPYIVISKDALNTFSQSQATIAHELFHAVQHATSAYTYDGSSAWYWEATASWAAGEVYPDAVTFAAFAGPYLMLPHLSLTAFDYPDEGLIEEYYQYGAFLFPHFLTETLGEPDSVVNSWDAPQGLNPIDALRAELADTGENFDELWFDHLIANVQYDYRVAGAIQDSVQLYNYYYGESDFEVTAVVGPSGTLGPESPRNKLLPGLYGANNIAMQFPANAEITIQVVGQAGKINSAAVIDFVEGEQVLPLTFDGLQGTLTFETEKYGASGTLVVGTWDDDIESNWFDTTFPYTYDIQVVEKEPDPVDPGDPEEPPAEGCGCGEGSSGSFLPLLLLLGLRSRR